MAKRKGGKKSKEPELVRRDGALCAVFVNAGTASRPPVETFAHLLAWGRENGALEAAAAERLEQAATERPGDALEVEGRMGEVRPLLERILLALARLQMPAAADLEALNAALKPVLAARHLAPGEGGFEWLWDDGEACGGRDLDRVLWPVLLSVAEVLASDDHLYVRQCAGEDCELVFVDRTPGRHRRWCSRKECGNRARAREYYRREVKPQRLRRKKRQLSVSTQREEPSD